MKKIIHSLINYFFREVTFFGGTLFYALLLAVLLSLNQMDLFYKTALGFVIIFLTAVLIRSFYFKERPNPKKYSTFYQKMDASSFPSVHTARTLFLGSTFFQVNQNLGILFFALAVFVAWSRYFLKKHFLIDIIAGGILGLILSFVL